VVIKSGASTARSEASADTQIDLWNILSNNDVWVFSHEVKELICKFLFIMTTMAGQS
jgi:hypothetical protein